MVSFKWLVSSFPPTFILGMAQRLMKCSVFIWLIGLMSSSPADALFHFSSPAIRNDVCEGESTVHHNATQLRVFLMEVSMSTQWSSLKKEKNYLHHQIYGFPIHNLSRLHPSTLNLPLILRADWNWYSSNKISFMDSWIEVKLKYGSVITMLVSAKSTCKCVAYNISDSTFLKQKMWCL